MSSIVVLAQALPSASSGVDWLYQFTNNLTNLTTQNGGALTQLGMTELSCIALFMLISMVVNWQTSTMTFRLHHHPVQAGDLTKFLLQLIICCLLEELLGEPVPRRELRHQSFLFLHRPGDGCGLRSEFARQRFLQLLKTAGDQTAMPSFTAPVQILCYFLVQVLLGLASAILFLINCSAFILYGVTALFGPIFVPLLMTKSFRGKFFHFLDVLIGFRHDSGRRRRLHLRLVGVHECVHPADLQRQLFDGNVARESHPLHDGFHRLHHQHAFHPEHDAGDLRRGSGIDIECDEHGGRIDRWCRHQRSRSLDIMWTFLAALLIGRATGGWRYMRAALLITLIGCVIVGLISRSRHFQRSP